MEQRLKDNPTELARRKAAYDEMHNANFAASGLVAPPPLTPEERALAAHNARWEPPPAPANFPEMFDVERDRVRTFTPLERERAEQNLRTEFRDQYDEMVRLGKASLAPGVAWDPANALSRPLLTYLAALGRFNEARDREAAALATRRR